MLWNADAKELLIGEGLHRGLLLVAFNGSSGLDHCYARYLECVSVAVPFKALVPRPIHRLVMMVNPQEAEGVIGGDTDNRPVGVVNPCRTKVVVLESGYLLKVDGRAVGILLELSLEIPHSQLDVLR